MTAPYRKPVAVAALVAAIGLTIVSTPARGKGNPAPVGAPPITGSYDLTFAITQGQPPFPIWTGGQLVISSENPLLGTISIPQLSLQDQAIQGVAATEQTNDGQFITTLTFTITSTGQTFYGMQAKQKLYGSTTIPSPSAAGHRIIPETDPGEDACWLATHSVG